MASTSRSPRQQHQDDLDRLMATFVGTNNLTLKQVSAMYKFSGYSFHKTSTCLSSGPTLSSIKSIICERFENLPRLKLDVDLEDAWSDIVAQYKSSSMNYYTQIRIKLGSKPPVDTGGVRRHIYSRVFEDFTTNKFVGLFDGPANYLRPACTAEARSSGLLKVLGSIIAHSICQDGIGFPYLSPTCYSYLVGGEDNALELVSPEDLPADSAFVVSQVAMYNSMVKYE